jgi:hypothetical protein
VVNVGFKIYDRNNTELYPMSGYSLPFEIFTFKANFSTTLNYISDKKVIWNFGDNTLSNDLTATHAYDYPGTYPVTLTVFTSTGDGIRSSVLSAIKIANYINDVLVLTTQEPLEERSGEDNNPIFLTRYNSWQTSISGKNTVIMLSVSGNRSPYVTPRQYYADKNSQFKSTTRFATNTDLGLTVVDEVSTSNTFLYASPAGTSINLSLSSGDGTYLAGSSGVAIFYYIEDYKI